MRKILYISLVLVIDAALGCLVLGLLVPNLGVLSGTGSAIITALIVTMAVVTILAIWRAFA